MSLSKLWLLSTVGTMEQMDKSRDPEVQHALRERIRREANKRRAGYIRPPTDMHSTSHCSVRRLLGSEYERHLTEAVQRRTAVAGRWFRIATEAHLARDFAAALCNLKSESLSRFTSSVLTETPLPTRASLRRWGVSTHASDKCPICDTETQTTRHILSGCRKALEQGRYTLRHNMVLQALANSVQRFSSTSQCHFDLPRKLGWDNLRTGRTRGPIKNCPTHHPRKLNSPRHAPCIAGVNISEPSSPL